MPAGLQLDLGFARFLCNMLGALCHIWIPAVFSNQGKAWKPGAFLLLSCLSIRWQLLICSLLRLSNREPCEEIPFKTILKFFISLPYKVFHRKKQMRKSHMFSWTWTAPTAPAWIRAKGDHTEKLAVAVASRQTARSVKPGHISELLIIR